MQPAAPALWFVVFFARDATRDAAWWARLLHPGYGHVMACRAQDQDRTLLVDHRGSRLVVDLVPLPVGLFLRSLQGSGTWTLATEGPGDAATRAQLRAPMTCTETVKAALGISAPLVLTPRQLARHLRSRGARPVLPIPS